MTREIELRYESYQDARDAIKRINEHAVKRSFQNWMTVGEGYRTAQNEAMEIAGVNCPDGNAYKMAFARVLEREKLHDTQKTGIDKNTRSILLRIMEHEPEVQAWHAALPIEQKREWNSPKSIWRHFHKPELKPKKEPTKLTAEEKVFAEEDYIAGKLEAHANKINRQQDIIRDYSAEKMKLQEEVLFLRKAVHRLMVRCEHASGLTCDFSKETLPTNEEIEEWLKSWCEKWAIPDAMHPIDTCSKRIREVVRAAIKDLPSEELNDLFAEIKEIIEDLRRDPNENTTPRKLA
jgi:hypothetical protein